MFKKYEMFFHFKDFFAKIERQLILGGSFI